MITAEFYEVRVRIVGETDREWDVVPMQTIAGRVTQAGLYYRGRLITKARCHERTPQWLYDLVSMIWRACMAYADADAEGVSA